MIRTVLTPEKEDISIHLPQNYVGKQIEVLMYAIDELTNDEPANSTVNNASLRGKLNLTEGQYRDFHQHAKDARKEWNEDI